MKRLMRWQCEICGRIYDKKDDCSECESRHDTINRIAITRYASGGERPYDIICETASGKRLEYQFVREVTTVDGEQ